MHQNNDFELDLLSYCLKKPIYLKQHKDRLKGLKFNDKFIGLIYKMIFKCLDSYNSVPTVSELQLIATETMNDKGKFQAIEIEAVNDIIKDIYVRPTTELTGQRISAFLVEDEAKKLSEDLVKQSSESLLETLPDLSQRLNKLKYFQTDDDQLGMNFFSEEGISAAKNILNDYNTVSCLKTGYTLLDHQLQGGMRKGELAVFIGSTNTGKANPISSKILTPTGYVKMGDLKVGDKVIDWDGNSVNILGVYPQGTKDVYSIKFTDGTSAECCDEHLWWTRNFASSNKDYQVLPLKNFMTKLKGAKGRNNWQMPVCNPIKFEEKELKIHPYVLGSILGDGCITTRSVGFTCGDPELIDTLRALIPNEITLYKQNSKANIDYNFTKTLDKRNPFVKNIFIEALEELHLIGTNSHTKFIPKEYLFGSVTQRLELLQGLMDTDGTGSGWDNTGVDYCCASLDLIEGVEFLVRSLGGVSSRTKSKIVNEKEYFRIYFTTPMCPFKLSRKKNKWQSRTFKSLRKVVDSVNFVRREECQCIQVDSPTSSYLMNDCIVTHNTSILLNFAVNFLKEGQRVVYIALDNIEGELIARTVGCMLNQSITQGVDAGAALDLLADSYKNIYADKFWYKHFAPRELSKSKLERYLDKLETHLYEKDKEANILPEEAWGKIDVIVLDYMDLMIAESGAGEFWIAAEHLAQEIKAVLKNRNILGLTATQGGTEAMKADTIKMHMAAGAKSKFNAPDLVFAISQDDHEKSCVPSKFRLGCLKARRPQTNYQIPFDFYKDRQVIRERDGATVLPFTEKVNSGAAKVTVTKHDYMNDLLFKIKSGLEVTEGKEDSSGNSDQYGET